MTLIGVPRENAPGERRVALVPKVVERRCGAGLSVVVETEAGAGALIPDEHYEEAGATIATTSCTSTRRPRCSSVTQNPRSPKSPRNSRFCERGVAQGVGRCRPLVGEFDACAPLHRFVG